LKTDWKVRGRLINPQWAIVSLLLSLVSASIDAQPSYTINWYKVAAGGGVSTGLTARVSGTIGQPDASDSMVSGGYSLSSGYWSVLRYLQFAAQSYDGFIFSNNGSSVTIRGYIGPGGVVSLPTAIPSVGIVDTIGSAAFSGQSILKSVTIPASVVSIGDRAFEFCSGLTNAYFQGNAPSFFGAGVFDFDAPGFTLYFPTTSEGFTAPVWNGYKAQPYNYQPFTGSGDTPLPPWMSMFLAGLLCLSGVVATRRSQAAADREF
jgi:hypothetical protein